MDEKRVDFESVVLEKLESVDYRLSNIEQRTRTLSQYVTRKDIAEELGCHVSLLSKKPWLIPNYGESNNEGKRGRWELEVWEAWKAIPVEFGS